jgi:AcrR family transcriptional regulator
MARPRGFRSEAVLRQALDTFWRQGYADTSLPDLSAATGLSSSSLYNAFGSKEQLFVQVLDVYLDATRTAMYGPMASGTQGVADVEAFLDRVQAVIEDPAAPPGCLATHATAETAASLPAVAERTLRFRRELREAFGAALARAARAGELPPSRVDELATALTGLMLGLNLLAGSGAPAEELRALIGSARALLPPAA